MTDELTTDLAKVSSLRVVSRTSVMRYKGSKKTLPQIARELNVDGIVEGSVMRSGQHVRITAQLIHAPSDRHVHPSPSVARAQTLSRYVRKVKAETGRKHSRE
jgi:TolB-like protein